MDFNLQNDIKPKLNGFELSHNHFTTMDMGKLCPIGWLECLPGDIFRLDLQSLIRVQPMIAPILNNLTCDVHAFFVPTRLLWKNWEDFITTIEQDSIPPKTFDGTPPVWLEHDDDSTATLKDIDTSAHSLWDMFGLSRIFAKDAKKELRPVDFLRRAYYSIWNEWFRDENLQEPIDFRNSDRQDLLYRAWRKDYFTAGYISRQKGTSPTIPLSGVGSAKWNTTFGQVLDNVEGEALLPIYPGSYAREENKNPVGFGYSNDTLDNVTKYGRLLGIDSNNRFLYQANSLDDSTKSIVFHASNTQTPINREAFLDYLNSNQFDFSQAGTFTVNDLREMFQIQKFLERLMMSGSRYIEFLQSQFGVSPSDSRLQIPERIGGTSFNIKVSEVLQTSSGTADSPQGNQSGHGLSVSAGSLGSYKCVEFGYILILANIQPPSVYVDRMPRALYRKTLLEQYNPHFVNLSFQAVNRREIYADGTDKDDEVFNYDGRYDELRECQSYVTGDLYDKLDYYLQFRKFTTAPAFNSDFIECKPDNNIFAVQDEPPFICNFWLNIKSLRPLPLVSEPGLIDHVYGGL